MNRTSLIALAAVLFSVAPHYAAAQACSPAAPSDGDAVTCSGTGTGIVDDGFDDGSIFVDVDAVITGEDQAFEFDDNVTFTNFGEVIGQGDHGVQGDNGALVENYGSITGDADGVNIDDDGILINYGSIEGLGDDGVQLEENAYGENYGSITAADEGVNINTDGAYLYNEGSIVSGDDGVNAAENAVIYNTGLIQSTGDQDGIDLDSGDIFNAGTIRSLGSEDGIDFDAGANPSTVTNTGLIEGTIAINTDPADGAEQTVINSGTLTGFGGTAVNLGAGDDTLMLLEGSVVNGEIEMGDGTDSVLVGYTTAGTLSFGSDPELIETAGPSLYAGSTLFVIDAAPLSAGDVLARGLAFGTAQAVLDGQSDQGFWGGAFASGGSVDGEDDAQDLDHREGGIVAGYGLGTGGLSVFLGYGGGKVELDDGDHELTSRALVAGLSATGTVGNGVRYDAALYAGRTRNELDSPSSLSGDAEYDGTLWGLSLRGQSMLWEDANRGMGVDLAVQGDVARHSTESYRLSGLGGKIDERDTTATALRLELGMPMQTGGMTLRPYAAYTALGGTSDDITFSAFGASTSFDAVDYLDDDHMSLGATLYSDNGFDGRFEVSSDGDGNTALKLSATLSF